MENDTKYFALFDADGFPDAFYADDVWAEDDLPAGKVEITFLQWQEFLAHPGELKWSGGEIVTADPPRSLAVE